MVFVGKVKLLMCFSVARSDILGDKPGIFTIGITIDKIVAIRRNIRCSDDDFLFRNTNL